LLDLYWTAVVNYNYTAKILQQQKNTKKTTADGTAGLWGHAKCVSSVEAQSSTDLHVSISRMKTDKVRCLFNSSDNMNSLR